MTFIRSEVSAIIIRDDTENNVLLVKKNGGKNWTLLKGGVQVGETDEQALCRGICEELDVNEGDFKILQKLGRYSFRSAAGGGKHSFVIHNVSVFLVKLLNTSNIRIPTAEIAFIRWVSRVRAQKELFRKNERSFLYGLRSVI